MTYRTSLLKSAGELFELLDSIQQGDGQSLIVNANINQQEGRPASKIYEDLETITMEMKVGGAAGLPTLEVRYEAVRKDVRKIVSRLARIASIPSVPETAVVLFAQAVPV